MKNTLISTIIIGLFVLSIGSCKKKDTMAASASSCTSTIYGYSATSSLDTNCTFGIVNASTATISSGGALMHYMLYSNQGAFNGADGYYYTLKASNNSSQSGGPLYKINSGGSAIAIAAPSGGAGPYSSLTYNKVANKLYCTTAGHLLEVTAGSSSFTTTSIATPVHPFYIGLTSAPLTVNNNNGDMYYVTGDTSGYFIEKYHAGAGSSVVATGGGVWEILGMRYNQNDNMLYAIRRRGIGGIEVFELIKIDPSSGSINSLATVSNYNPEFFSACIDPCTNHYIVSTLINTGAVLDQYNTTGTLVQHNTLSAPILGLDVWTTSL